MSRSATRVFHSRRTRLPLLVDGQCDDGGAVLLDDLHHAVHPGPGSGAVLVVDRVDDGSTAEQLQARLDHLGLGRVDHQRQRGRGGEPADQLAHVGGAVTADVVGVDVEQVRAVADLVLRDPDAVVPALARASPRGTPWSRWRSCARRSTGTRCPAGTAPTGRGCAAPASDCGSRATTSRPRTRSTTRRRCSGVVPQQPPTRPSPYSRVKVSWACASSSGVSGYQAPLPRSSGSPALGMQEIPTRACRARWRRCSLISAGPVAQFRPIMSMPSGSSAVSAAPISEPTSIVPVVSTVTCTRIGRSAPAAAIERLRADDGGLRLQQVLAGLDRGSRRRRRRRARPPAPGTRPAAWRTARARRSAAWYPGRPTRGPSAGARRVAPGVGRLAGDAGRRPRPAR